MKKSLLILSLCVLSFSANAQNTTKTEKIKQLLELTGSAKLGLQMFDQMVSRFKKPDYTTNQQFRDDMRKEINTDDLQKLIIPIYDKYYTESDIDQLIAFYNSAIGKKMIQNLPLVMQESMTVGQNWAREITEKVSAKLKEKGN